MSVVDTDYNVTVKELSDYTVKNTKPLFSSMTVKSYMSVPNMTIFRYAPLLTLNRTTVTLSANRTFQLTTAYNGTDSITWRTSNSSIASVSSTGKIIAKNPGTATITASAAGISVSCYVKVTAAANTPGIVKITKTDSSKQNRFTISWQKVSGVSGYQIYTATNSKGKYTKLKTLSAKTFRYTFKVKSGKTLYIKVRSYKKSGSKNYYGTFSSTKKMTEIGAYWYKSLLNAKSKSFITRCQDSEIIQSKRIYLKDYPYYMVTDLNKDGIKELILHSDFTSFYDENRIQLITYYGDKVRPLVNIGGCGARGKFWITGKNLVVCTSSSSSSYSVYFTVSRGKLVKVRDLRYWNDKMPGRPYRQYYYVNGKSVSFSAWIKVRKKYFYEASNQLKFQRY